MLSMSVLYAKGLLKMYAYLKHILPAIYYILNYLSKTYKYLVKNVLNTLLCHKKLGTM